MDKYIQYTKKTILIIVMFNLSTLNLLLKMRVCPPPNPILHYSTLPLRARYIRAFIVLQAIFLQDRVIWRLGSNLP